jgi:hypothetical protein
MSLDEVDWNIMVPMMVNRTQTGTIVANFHETLEMSHKVRTADTFSDYIATLPEHICQLLMHYEFTPGGERTLKACLKRNMLLKLGTDGSGPTDWDRRILQYGKRNGIIWMGVDRK